MNNYIFYGNLGGDAVVRQTQSGGYAIGFNVAVSEKYKDKEGKTVENTTWVRCTKWVSQNGSTKIADYLKKGAKVIVRGKPTATHFTDKNGEVRSSLDVRVDELHLAGVNTNGGGSQEQSSYSAPVAQEESFVPDPATDDLPF